MTFFVLEEIADEVRRNAAVCNLDVAEEDAGFGRVAFSGDNSQIMLLRMKFDGQLIRV